MFCLCPVWSRNFVRTVILGAVALLDSFDGMWLVAFPGMLALECKMLCPVVVCGLVVLGLFTIVPGGQNVHTPSPMPQTLVSSQGLVVPMHS